MEWSEILGIANLFANLFVGTMIFYATFKGPSRAIQDQKNREKEEIKRDRKLQIFHTLMATRSDRVSDRHIEALNMIDIEYHYDINNKVINAWNEYYDHLTTHRTEENSSQWDFETDKLFINMLYEIALSLGYNYTKLDIKNRCYSPKNDYYKRFEEEEIRRYLAAILAGRLPLQVKIKGEEEKTHLEKSSV